MKAEQKERWKQLCEQVADEKDPARFSKLVAELLEELKQKDQRLKVQPNADRVGQATPGN